ncbi:WhiB family transcriptional regulator [Rhodococcus opacus]|uniref:WhiB family transcriptional regulator n=1 Tax=Rhodococcus opacus TaxID=37919 RepID=UPI001F53FB9E|nr:WhiB family transcriptional regulator [Rhodococcus opacus]
MNALCRIISPALFFRSANERGQQRRKRISEAKKICFRCPVIEACRDYALTVGKPFGIWGGLPEEERDHVFDRGRAGKTGRRGAEA